MQVQGEYEAKEKTMVAYLERVKQLVKGFEHFQLHQVPRAENARADALAKFESSIAGVSSRKVVVLRAEEPEIGSEKDPIDLCPTTGIPRNPLAHKRDFKTSRAVKGVPQEVPRAPRKILRSQGTLRSQGLVPKIEIKLKGILKDPRAHKRDLKTSQAVEGVSQEAPRAPRKILRSQGTLRSQGLVPKIEIKWKGIPKDPRAHKQDLKIS
ncbi:hypothetical protein DH2020_013071 [Rehmannia glutinosa]|uniref:RNase H type-1 domain-containing protein n=1 Tax=Rehmannia glutinosa TaxID=99300 RepID=A0ABR0X4B5_REHGL